MRYPAPRAAPEQPAVSAIRKTLIKQLETQHYTPVMKSLAVDSELGVGGGGGGEGLGWGRLYRSISTFLGTTYWIFNLY